jgi:hypothetical protein
MTTLINYESYPAIRAAIDVTLDSLVLPDDIIGLPIYLGTADREIKTRDPLWATRTGAEAQALATACIFLTASLLAPAMPRIISQTISSGGDTFDQKFQSIDWEARAAALRQLSEDAIDSVLDVGDVVSARPTRFRNIAGRRGRW